MLVTYAIVGRAEDVKLYRSNFSQEYTFVELKLPGENASDMKPGAVEQHARWLEFSGRDMFSIAMPERDAYYVHMFSDSTANELPLPAQHAVTLRCLLAVAKHRNYEVVDPTFSEQVHSWDTDVRIMAQYLWNAYCRQTDSATFLKALASFRSEDMRPFLTEAYNDLVTFRQKLVALDGARSNWKINTKDVTGLVCGDAL
jgi:hypothetical protein